MFRPSFQDSIFFLIRPRPPLRCDLGYDRLALQAIRINLIFL
jgi:hypothetical protein